MPTSRSPRATADDAIVPRLRHAPEQEGGEGAEQQAEAERRRDGEADHPRAEEDGDEREEGGERPHERLESLHRDAQRQRPVARLSAAARMAMPARVRRRNNARATQTIGMTTAAMTSLAWKIVPPISTSRANGGSRIGASSRSSPKAFGRRMAPAARSWVRPRVATVSSRRGERAKRRMTASSTTAPSSRAPRMPAVSDGEVGPAPRVDQQERQDDRRRPEVGVGEVDDAVRPVRQGHAEGDERGEATEEHAPQPLAEREREQQELEGDDGRGGHGRLHALEKVAGAHAGVAVWRVRLFCDRCCGDGPGPP